MIYILKGYPDKRAVEEVLLSVLMWDSVQREEHIPQGENYLLCEVIRTDRTKISTKLYYNNELYVGSKIVENEGKLRHSLKLCVYETLINIVDKTPLWGSLTGVRPAKLIKKFIKQNMTTLEVFTLLTETYHVEASRARLGIICARKAIELEERLEKRDISVYAGIPFCPSRCYYCSFVSHSIENAGHLIQEYTDILLEEIKYTANIFKNDFKITSMYLGGGTPTILSTDKLTKLIKSLNNLAKNPCEFTVEAGRADTLDYEKLSAIYNENVTRISINPQTLDDNVLKNVGRRHSAQDVYEKYKMARDIGFDNINMDVIAGLLGDTPKSFEESLKKIIHLRPENITVHTLAIKKGATLQDKKRNVESADITEKMIETSFKLLTYAGYLPYYTYRQKYMAGGFENIGWTLPNFDCEYNILMMEEIQSICGFGAGAVSKFIEKENITRIINPKYPYEYNNSKQKIFANKAKFYDCIYK